MLSYHICDGIYISFDAATFTGKVQYWISKELVK